MRQKLMLATTALATAGLATMAVAMSGPAFATTAPVPYSWTRCYVGANAGAAWGHTNFSDPGYGGGQNFAPQGAIIGVDDRASFLAGAQAGCDYQFASRWVVGLGGDFSWTNIQGISTDPYFSGKNGNPITLHAQTNYLATATGRIGYAWDQFMVYGKGGAAWARDKDSVQNLSSFNGEGCTTGAADVGCNPARSETRVGWTAGVGVEWAFAKSWSALAEFDYYGFGTKAVLFAAPNVVTTPSPFNLSQNFEAVKIGINYRFH